MLIGIHTLDGNYAAANAHFGGNLKIARVFPSGMPIDLNTVTPANFVAKVKAVCDPVIAAGMIPFFSYKFVGEPTVVLSGGADLHYSALRDYFDSHPDQQFYGTEHHEDEQTSISDSDFAAMSGYSWLHTFRPNYRSGPIYQGFPYGSRPFNPARIPAHYDFLAIDCYITDNEGQLKSLGVMPEFQTFIANIPTGAPVFLTERGITDGSGSNPPWDPALQGQTIQGDFTELDSIPNPVEGYIYWNQHADAPKLAQYTMNAYSEAVFSLRAAQENVPPIPQPVDVELGVDVMNVETTLTIDAVLDVVKCGVCAALLSGAQSDTDLHYAALHTPM